MIKWRALLIVLRMSPASSLTSAYFGVPAFGLPLHGLFCYFLQLLLQSLLCGVFVVLFCFVLVLVPLPMDSSLLLRCFRHSCCSLFVSHFRFLMNCSLSSFSEKKIMTIKFYILNTKFYERLSLHKILGYSFFSPLETEDLNFTHGLFNFL